jgi:hypothetical protein
VRRLAWLPDRRPCGARRIPVAVAARRRCSGGPLRAGRPLRIRHPFDTRSLSADRWRGVRIRLPADGRESSALLGQNPLGCRFPPETASHCGLPVIHSMPLRPSCRQLGRRIRRQGKSTPRKSSPHRQAAGSSPCPGMGIRTPSTFGMSTTGNSSTLPIPSCLT